MVLFNRLFQHRSLVLRANVSLLLGVVLVGCSRAEAADPAKGFETLVMHELASQVTVSKGHELARLDGPKVEEGVGGAILLNSELIIDGTFVEAGADSTVEGGRVIGTMHGECMTSGGALSLTVGGTLGTIAKCEQALNLHDRGQVIVSGLIEQQNFEHNQPQSLAVLGGTGDFVGVTGELVVTQLVFPGIVKHLELRIRRPQ